jgi:hypothetical protein
VQESLVFPAAVSKFKLVEDKVARAHTERGSNHSTVTNCSLYQESITTASLRTAKHAAVYLATQEEDAEALIEQ